MSLWLFILFCATTHAAPNGNPKPPGKALGHQNENNPHYVAPIVEEEQRAFGVCPTLSSAPHLCVNYQ
jgi:hypothetical protein